MPAPEMDPDIVGRGVKLKVVQGSTRQGISFDGQNSATNVLERISDLGGFTKIWTYDRHSTYILQYVDFTWGTDEAPQDGDEYNLLLTKAPDTRQLRTDDTLALLDRAMISVAHHWEIIADGASTIQTFESREVLVGQDSDLLATDLQVTGDSFSMQWLFAANRNDVLFVIFGVAFFDFIAYQRSWPSRNSSEWAGWNAGMDGENYGQFGS